MDETEHQRSMLMSYTQKRFSKASALTPFVIGWSQERNALYEANHKKPKTNQLTLWVQDFKLNLVNAGKIVIPRNTIIPTIVDNQLSQSVLNFQTGPLLQMGSGHVTFDFLLPNIEGAAYSKLEIDAEPNNEVKVELWNAQTQLWESIQLGAKTDKNEQQTSAYLLENKKIRMKATTIRENTMFRLPTVALEGAVKP
ncbi:hypothetical protein D3C73_936250 [compost metagenome]